MAAKDERIVVRMASDLKQWVHGEAEAIGIDDAAFVRMVLLQRKRGADMIALRPTPAEVLAAALPIYPARLAPAPGEAAVSEPDAILETDASGDGAETPLSAHDIDALVQQQVADAEAKGLTRVVRPDFDDDEPHQMVRGLHQVKREPGKAWANRYTI